MVLSAARAKLQLLLLDVVLSGFSGSEKGMSVARAEAQLLLLDIVLSGFSGMKLWLMPTDRRMCSNEVGLVLLRKKVNCSTICRVVDRFGPHIVRFSEYSNFFVTNEILDFIVDHFSDCHHGSRHYFQFL